MGPVAWRAPPTGLVRSRQAAHCSRAANDAGLVSSAWLQSRCLVRDHCSHTWSCQVNGALASRVRTAACRKPALPWSDMSGVRHLLGCHYLGGPTVRGPYRQAVMGSRAPPVRRDVKGRWQQCHAVPRSSSVQGTVATPNPRFGDKGFTIATPHHVLLKGAQTLIARGGRLLDAALSRGWLAGVSRSCCCWLVVGRPLVAGRRASRPPKGGASAWGTARRSWPKVLINPGTRVRLPVAHYSDIICNNRRS